MNKKTNFVLRNTVCLAIVTSTLLPLSAYAQEHAIGRILIKTNANAPQARIDALLKNNNARIISTIKGVNVHIIKVPAHTEETVRWALSHNPNIAFAELDTLNELEETIPNDYYYSAAWHLPTIGAPAAWDMSMGTGVTVAVLDTGVDANHPDLQANMLPGINAVDKSTNTNDIAGHGTKVAGVIGAIGNNMIEGVSNGGVAGAAWNVKILPVRVSNATSGSAYTSDIAYAIKWAAEHGAQIANASYALTFSSTIRSAADYLKSYGGLLVVSAGNDGSEWTNGDAASIISVSATASNDTKTSWSTYGSFVDVAAPGAEIWTTTNGGGYAAVSGTSFSSPLTAGVLALMKSANPNLTPDELENILETTAKDLGASGFDNLYGHGRIDAYQAVLAAMNATGSGGGSSGGSSGSTAPALDTTAPTVSLSVPGTTVIGTATISANATDNVQLDLLEIYAGSNLLGSSNTGSLSVNWNTTLYPDGNISLIAIATDSSGNSSTKSTTVNIANNIANDTEAPTLTISGITEGANISRNTTVTINAKDNVGLSTVNCLINGSLVSSSNTSLTCDINVKKLKSGAHILTANAVDLASHKTSTSVNFTIGSGSSSDGTTTGRGKGRKK